MDANGVVNAKDVNWSLIKPQDLRETQYKSHYAYVKYNDPKAVNGRLRVRLGKMKAPFGASSLTNEKGEISYNVCLSFTDLGANDPELGDSFKFCENWDNWFREEAKKKSKVFIEILEFYSNDKGGCANSEFSSHTNRNGYRSAPFPTTSSRTSTSPC